MRNLEPDEEFYVNGFKMILENPRVTDINTFLDMAEGHIRDNLKNDEDELEPRGINVIVKHYKELAIELWNEHKKKNK